MSAIFGLIHFDEQPVDTETLQPAWDLLRHRGPDGHNRWQDGSVLLAHWRFCTTPESLHEQQPLVAPEGNLVLVADARIDNREELLKTLGLHARAERVPITDAELILAAYQRWGTECPDRLIGDFAFAIWDRLARRLFAARDGMGVRPFYYLYDGRRFAFCTLLPALRQLPGVPQEIDEEMILRFLAQQIDSEKERTFYAALRRLPGGHALQVDKQGLQIWQHWQPNFEELRLGTEEAYAEAFRATFEEAVRCRLRSRSPVGSQLSGGLDSSSVSCMAAFLLRDQPLHTYSAIFPDLPEAQRPAMDERAYVEAVHRRYPNIAPHFFRPEFESPLVALETILDYYGQPFFASNYHFLWGFTQLAQRDGVRVMLDGVDGDSVVLHAWERLTWLFQDGQWATFKQEADAFAAHLGKPSAAIARQFAGPALTTWGRQHQWLRLYKAVRWLKQAYGLPASELLRIHGLWPHVPKPVFRRWQQWRGRQQPVDAPVLSPRLAAWMRRNGAAAASGQSSPAAAHWQGLTRGLWQWVLEFSDALNGLQGIEERMPFFDRRLIELSLRIPIEMKFRQGWPRYVLRRALEGILPPEVQWRASKSNIGFGFHQGLLRYEHARIKALLEEPVQLAPFVTAEALQALWTQAQRPPEQNGNADFMLYLLLILDAWLKGHAANVIASA
ncbi:lasso peptide isopeptide bond-forming cyclase [Rhodothermus bifroesti]|uniref:asparagine synthase (glutamine-hydrolyzing) n=1 Tax=Rhodothermus marinus TaxID=29549 RepID=A0A7V2F6H5_RHOMR|nr:lasso peptide isopeptide bond-forming cyclase [Rhodothermus bifroesti]GBD00871.1 Asparagine synthetase [glutamine-hydrolyzing] 3 [bacterium HR18]